MTTRTVTANGADLVQRRAAHDAHDVQDACNIVAIVGCWHQHLIALHRAEVYGDALINHPVCLAFLSKLNSLCRMTTQREIAALDAIEQLRKGETAQYEVIPL